MHLLSLRELEDVLLAVDDLQAAAIIPQANVSRVEPAVSVEGLCCLVGHLIIAPEYAWATDTHLPAWWVLHLN